MDKGKLIENLIREGHEKGGFTGAWLYAEHGEIISKGAIGMCMSLKMEHSTKAVI